MKKHRLAIWLSFLLIFVMALAACGGDDEEPAEDQAEAEVMEEDATEDDAAEEDMAEDEAMDDDTMTAHGGGEYLTRAMAGEFAGTKVTMFGPFTDEDEALFNEAISGFEETTGIDIEYVGSKEFEAAISVRVDGGDAPDIADFPQPGLLGNFAREGKIVDVSSYMSEDALLESYNSSWLDMAKMDGADGEIMAGVWQRFNGKSLVFYPKAQFDAAGYEVPTTWEELLALTQLIADDGDPAWCIGIESGVATGWTATDWTEEMMLRTASLEDYDAWTKGELPFDSPQVKNAIETWGEIWFNDDFVFGGTDSIVGTFFGDSPTAMFEDPPQCWLHKQGNFITSFFPEGAEYGSDYGFFYMPPVDEAYGKPFLVAGDIMGQFNDRDEVRAVMEYFTLPDSAAGWMQTGGALSPHLQATPDMYGSDVARDIAAAVAEATSFRFDGSDLMPGEVGAGSFWTGMTDYVSGAQDLDTILGEIDASWPAGIEGQAMSDDTGDEEMADMGAGYLDRAMAGEFSGTTVTMFGPFTDEDEVLFNEAVSAFEEATGIDIEYVGSKEFEAAISVRVDGGDAPDIADFPQPGLLGNFVREGKIVDVASFIPEETLLARYNPSWLDMAAMEGPDGDITAGVWQRFNGKSLVFYPQAQFEAAGYEVPTTWEELIALTQLIADDGDPAWCIGIESGVATGWTATDWTEEMMLRTASLEDYDAWTKGELPFASDQVKNAIETWGEIWFNDDFVFGGTDSIVGTFFGDSPTAMFEDPPQCWLHKQGNFITSFFPEGAEYGSDYGFFYLPPVDQAYGKPFLVAGDIMGMFNDRDEVRAVMEYFTLPDSAAGWMQTGGALSPHLDATPEMYGSDVARDIAAAVAEATSFRFDGSDLMPGEVGAGSFWTGMTDYVSGAQDLDTVLEEIDASWPQD